MQRTAVNQRRLHLEPLEARLALAADATWTEPPKVELSVRMFKPDGTELTSLAVGEDFVLKVFATDLRPEPLGVYSAYVDITWDSSLAVATGAISHSAPYLNGRLGAVSAGLVEEAGGFAGLGRHGGGAFELFRVPMRAVSTGELRFAADPADIGFNEVLLHGMNDEILDGSISYGSASIVVGAGSPVLDSFVAAQDEFRVPAGQTDVVLTPLLNDVSLPHHENVLTIAAAQAPNHGGQIRIAADGMTLIYSPERSFTGTEVFTYTATNQYGEQHTATVAVVVFSFDSSHVDRPAARDDRFTVEANSSGNALDLLANDLTFSDTDQQLSLLSVRADHARGTVSIIGNQVLYTPPRDFVGFDRFFYTAIDGRGMATVAEATVHIVRLTAADDEITVEDFLAPLVIDVLANDSPGVGPKEELRIVSVTPPSPDMPISIAPDGKSLVFAGTSLPAGSAMPRGHTNIGYVVSDATGVLSSATLAINFASAILVTPGLRLEDGVLHVTGTAGDDRLVLSVRRGRLRADGSLDGQPVHELFPVRGFRKIIATLGDGNDALTVRSNVGAALRVDAGAGNDTIIAGLGTAVLIGGDGDDLLRGGPKRDVLIGGPGSDRLLAARAHDLALQDATAYDGDWAALDAIATEWGSKRSLSARRANLRQGAGPVLGPLEVALDAAELAEIPGVPTKLPLASRGR